MGEIIFASVGSRRWLREFFRRPRRVALLPHRVCLWLIADLETRGKESLMARAGGRRLFIHRLRPHSPDAIALSLECFRNLSFAASRRHSALTCRQTEVLGWIAAGKSNREMAEILTLSPRTINKHLESIFQKLGVENRTAAASFYEAVAAGQSALLGLAALCWGIAASDLPLLSLL